MSFLLKAAKDYNISEQDAKQGMLLLQSYNLKNHVPWEVFPGHPEHPEHPLAA